MQILFCLLGLCILFCKDQTQFDLSLFSIPKVIMLWAATCSGTPGWSHHLAWHVLGCLSKQIKGVRTLKDDGGCFYVFPQAAVAPIGLEEWIMGLKHSACSQMQGRLYRTSKGSIIYILVIHSDILMEDKFTNSLIMAVVTLQLASSRLFFLLFKHIFTLFTVSYWKFLN